MSTLIVYATKHGCTEKCARMLSERLTGRVDLCNLKRTKAVDLSRYYRVIVGGSIYMGKIQKEVVEFCSKNIDVLKDKKIGLFICCMREGDTAEEQLNNAFSQQLLSAAAAKGVFGGEFVFKKMNPLERFIVKKVSKVHRDVSTVSEESINAFVDLMNSD